MKRALVVVLDSVGCGHAPDAASFGDAGANTLGHLFERIPDFHLPGLASLGLEKILGRAPTVPVLPDSQCVRLSPRAAGKDTTAGHWELMGFPIAQPFATFHQFPQELVREIEERAGVIFLGNYPASGTEILKELGEEHLKSGRPILYTSSDSVMQIAAHELSFGLDRLLELCRCARETIDQRNDRIGRVIARPFMGSESRNFRRTANRRDFSLVPGETTLNRLQAAGVSTLGVGKIADIFAGSGIDASYPTHSNAEGMEMIETLWCAKASKPSLIFANLVDFDSLYGHRRDASGYAQCLREFDAWLVRFLSPLDDGDLILITADHGNDPYHSGTDHTREQVPLMLLGQHDPVDDSDFGLVGRLLEQHFGDCE